MDERELPEGTTEEAAPSGDAAIESQGDLPVEGAEFKDAFGEMLEETLDISSWEPGDKIADLYPKLEQEIALAAEQGRRIRSRVRDVVLPRLRTRPGAPAQAGLYQATPEQVEQVHQGLLFAGAVDACDGTSVVHDTLPVTIAQIGICLVSYQGSTGSWIHRMFRRDLRVGGGDPVDEALELLERRRDRSGFDTSNRRDVLTDLARRGIMAFAERAVLLRKSEARWRVGHGNPAPYELLTGSGMKDLVEASLPLLEDLILDHKRIVYVPSAGNRMYLTIADALRPLEYVVIDTTTEMLQRVVERGHYRGAWQDLAPKIDRFAEQVGENLVVGVFRASTMAPGQIFYAHKDHVHEAALIAIADSVLQEHRGFPMLIDLADQLCTATFGNEAFADLTKLAYVEAGEPFRYLSERQTR